MKRIVQVMAGALLLAGCAHYQPYPGAAAGASPAEREQLYRDFSFSQDERGLLYAQGETITPGNAGPHSAENYAKKSAPDIAYPRKSKMLLMGRDGAWLAGLGGSILWWTQDPSAGWAGYTAAWTIVLDWILDWDGRGERAALQDAQAFNQALAADLGLGPQAGLDTHPILRANDADQGWRFGLAGRFERVSALDMQSYFTTPTGAPSWRFQDYWDGRQVLSAGYGWHGGWHLTGELGPVAERSYGIGWSSGETADHHQTVDAMSARLGKAFTFMGSPHHQLSLSPELTVGWAMLQGRYTEDDANGNELGAYSYAGNAPLIGASLRLAVPLSGSFAVTLELGYDSIVFSSVDVTGSSGDLAGRGSPDQNWRGEPTVWDYSGPVIRFGTEFY